jgi:hypothetical protein
MKTKIILLLLAALPLCTKAQITISNGDMYYNGDAIQMQNADPDSFNAGGSGADQIWNFNTIASNGSQTSFTVQNNNTSSFPNANIVLTYSNGVSQYIKETSTDSYIMGLGSATNADSEDYNNGIHIDERPFAYMNNYLDSYLVITPTMHGEGYITVNVDAYGTLILPSGSYTVLRIKRTIQETDTSASNLGDVFSNTTRSYLWFDANNSAPLLRIDSVYNSQLATNTPTIEYLANPTGIKTVSNGKGNFSAAFDNSELVVNGSFEQNNNYKIAVYDIAGQQVFATNYIATGYIAALDTHTRLASGMYLVRLINTSSPSEINVIKVVKQ